MPGPVPLGNIHPVLVWCCFFFEIKSRSTAISYKKEEDAGSYRVCIT